MFYVSAPVLLTTSINQFHTLFLGGLHKSWRKRYFILKDNCLYYFKNVGVRKKYSNFSNSSMIHEENTKFSERKLMSNECLEFR